MCGAVFPTCCLTWEQPMVEVMKIMVTSFKRSFARIVALNDPDPVAGHCWQCLCWRLLGKSRESLGQSLVGSLLLSPGSWCHKVLFVPSRSLFPQSYVTSGSSMVGLTAICSKRAHGIPRSAQLKKVGKTTRSLRYALNQISYFTVEVTNRFKVLDLIDRVPEELWTEVRDIVQ